MRIRRDELVPRKLLAVTAQRMKSEPVILLNGPRAVGKSTLLAALAAAHSRAVVDLDDLATREAVRSDVEVFARGSSPVFIDEFQHAPDLLWAIKAELNKDAGPGRFIITGSTRYSTVPEAGKALTGRLHQLDVRPLSQAELERSKANFAATALQDPSRLLEEQFPPTERREYVERVVSGGFPPALRRPKGAERLRWFDDYVRLVIDRDVMELSRIEQREMLPRLLRQLASQTGQVLNASNAAKALGLKERTVENYVQLLEQVFLTERLSAWGVTLGSGIAKRPKVHVVDSGLAARLLRLTEDKLNTATPTAVTEFGHLFETFVIGEISKQLDWLDEPVVRGHWRTHKGAEVDLVVERMDGKVLAIEVKGGSRILPKDLKGLTDLRGKLGSDFMGGMVVYTGEHAYRLEDSIYAVPADRLWRSGQ